MTATCPTCGAPAEAIEASGYPLTTTKWHFDESAVVSARVAALSDQQLDFIVTHAFAVGKETEWVRFRAALLAALSSEPHP